MCGDFGVIRKRLSHANKTRSAIVRVKWDKKNNKPKDLGPRCPIRTGAGGNIDSEYRANRVQRGRLGNDLMRGVNKAERGGEN